ncbi:hypothetical protein D1AOALGA4SA_8061 [Olavius algarvensis Delta 1 endosymbiont]|nr:hypothetical protein D1AOALGA4SA_8061 [Olavius algarvensis Delta 1 endosymbiont]
MRKDIENFRLKIEDLRNSIHYKKGLSEAKSTIFNLQSSIFNSAATDCGFMNWRIKESK